MENLNKRLCSAKGPNSQTQKISSQVLVNPLNFEEKNYVVNDTEFDEIKFIVQTTPKPTDETNIGSMLLSLIF